jgi:hypothetical protein
MPKGSSTLNILGGLLLKSTKPAKSQEKTSVRDASTVDKKKKNAPVQSKEAINSHLATPPVRNLIKPKINELDMGNELKAMLTPKKGGPNLTPKS